MTKSFTCAAVLALRDEGVLSLDVPVSEYAPELAAVRGPLDSPPITLRHLMSMQAGLATDDPWADRHLDISASDIDTIYAAAPAFAAVTGTTYEYSNLGFGMIGRVVQRATGMRVQQHISERFLSPLGMHRSTWVEPSHSDWARPFRVQDGVSIPDPHHPIGDGEIAPMGGLWTTVRDLAQWVTFLNAAHGDHAATNSHLLSAASRREMQMVHTHIGRSVLGGRNGTAGYGFGAGCCISVSVRPRKPSIGCTLLNGWSSRRLMARACATAVATGTFRSRMRYAPHMWLARHATVQCSSTLPSAEFIASAKRSSSFGPYGFSGVPRIGMWI